MMVDGPELWCKEMATHALLSRGSQKKLTWPRILRKMTPAIA